LNFDWNTLIISLVPSAITGTLGYFFGLRKENSEIKQIDTETNITGAEFRHKVLLQTTQLFDQLQETQAKLVKANLEYNNTKIANLKNEQRIQDLEIRYASVEKNIETLRKRNKELTERVKFLEEERDKLLEENKKLKDEIKPS